MIEVINIVKQVQLGTHNNMVKNTKNSKKYLFKNLSNFPLLIYKLYISYTIIKLVLLEILYF